MTMMRATLSEPTTGLRRHTFEVACGRCNKKVNMTVHSDDFSRWKRGMNVQTAFPYLNAKYHELLVTGICSECTDAELAGANEEHDR